MDLSENVLSSDCAKHNFFWLRATFVEFLNNILFSPHGKHLDSSCSVLASSFAPSDRIITLFSIFFNLQETDSRNSLVSDDIIMLDLHVSLSSGV